MSSVAPLASPVVLTGTGRINARALDGALAAIVSQVNALIAALGVARQSDNTFADGSIPYRCINDATKASIQTTMDQIVAIRNQVPKNVEHDLGDAAWAGIAPEGGQTIADVTKTYSGAPKATSIASAIVVPGESSEVFTFRMRIRALVPATWVRDATFPAGKVYCVSGTYQTPAEVTASGTYPSIVFRGNADGSVIPVRAPIPVINNFTGVAFIDWNATQHPAISVNGLSWTAQNKPTAGVPHQAYPVKSKSGLAAYVNTGDSYLYVTYNGTTWLRRAYIGSSGFVEFFGADIIISSIVTGSPTYASYVYRSSDDGATIYPISGLHQANGFLPIAVLSTYIYKVYSFNQLTWGVYRSSGIDDWTLVSSLTSEYRTLHSVNSKLFLTCINGASQYLLISSNGTSWSNITLQTWDGSNIYCVTYFLGKWVVFSSTGNYWTSVDAVSWTKAASTPFATNKAETAAVSADGSTLCVSGFGAIQTTTDLVSWVNGTLWTSASGSDHYIAASPLSYVSDLRALIQVDTTTTRFILNGTYGDPSDGIDKWYGTPTGGSAGWNSGFEFLIAVDYEVNVTVFGGQTVTVTFNFPNTTTKAGALAYPLDDDELFPYAPAYRDSAAGQIDITLFRPYGRAA